MTTPVNQALEDYRASLIETATLDSVPVLTELISGTLMTDSLNFLQGRPGSCKSFVALDMAGSVATGIPWQSRTTKKGRVLYVVAEGAGGLKPRVRAWEDARDVMMYGVWFLPRAVQVLDTVFGAAFALLCAELNPAMIVIDTQARSSVGLNENSAEDMGRFIGALENIRESTGACILMVHHEGRAGDHMRGSTVMEGAAQTVLRTTKEGGLVTLTTVKQKDTDEPPPIEMVVKSVGNSIVLNALRKTWQPHQPALPVALMRKVSDALENASVPLPVRGVLDRVAGRTEAVRQALAFLVDGGNVEITYGANRSQVHTLLVPFRGDEDT